MISSLFRRKHLFIIIVINFLITGGAYAQGISAALQKKIDGLFADWNTTGSPGCTIGIVRNDSLIYAKGYGMANLEYGIINTPEIIFHMASVSKQFTAYSIVLLAKQGKLNLDDDIHKYLPWFPDLHQTITIRNLLNHTSGIRDQWQLLAMAGTRLDDVITQEQIVKVLSKQQALNFKPGDEYSYSNSGFTLLAEIVKSVSGKTLRQFTDSAIFKPLGMLHTHFHDDYQEIEKNRSYSYDMDDKGHFENSILSYSNDGATSLFTNIPDMSKWMMNFYNTKVGDAGTIAQLTQKGILNSGKELNYALGISVDKYRGQLRYSHNGADAGYRTSVEVFPGLMMAFIVFSNLGNFNPTQKARQMEDFFIKDPSPQAPKPASRYTNLDTAVLTDTSSVKPFTGSYISEDAAKFSFYLKNNKLYWGHNRQSDLLIKTARDTFAMFSSPEVKFSFAIKGKTEVVCNEFWPDGSRLLTRYDTSAHYTDKQLTEYTGIYECPELDCRYGIIIKNHQLMLTNNKYDDTKLSLYGRNQLTNDFWWMNNLQVIRSKSGKIQGFEVNSGRIRHVWFKKIG